MKLAEAWLDRLRVVLALIGPLEGGNGVEATRRYSERIREHLRVETDKSDLEHAVLKTLAAFCHANPWLDLDKAHPERDTAPGCMSRGRRILPE